MSRYRYRTSVLAGPWRDSPETAFLDAIRARQVRHDDDQPATYRWLVPGGIEEEERRERRRSVGG